MLFASHAPPACGRREQGEEHPCGRVLAHGGRTSPERLGSSLSRARRREVGAVATSNVPGLPGVAQGWTSRAPCSDRPPARTPRARREASCPRRRRCLEFLAGSRSPQRSRLVRSNGVRHAHRDIDRLSHEVCARVCSGYRDTPYWVASLWIVTRSMLRRANTPVVLIGRGLAIDVRDRPFQAVLIARRTNKKLRVK
jgi:hypothetical protein